MEDTIAQATPNDNNVAAEQPTAGEKKTIKVRIRRKKDEPGEGQQLLPGNIICVEKDLQLYTKNGKPASLVPAGEALTIMDVVDGKAQIYSTFGAKGWLIPSEENKDCWRVF